MGIAIHRCKTVPVASVTIVSVSSAGLEDTHRGVHGNERVAAARAEGEEDKIEGEEYTSGKSSRSSSNTCHARSASFAHAYRSKRRRSSARSLSSSSSFEEYPFDGASSNTLSSSLSSIQLAGTLTEDVTVHPLAAVDDGCYLATCHASGEQHEREEAQLIEVKHDSSTRVPFTPRKMDFGGTSPKRRQSSTVTGGRDSSMKYLLGVLTKSISFIGSTKMNNGFTLQEELQLQSLNSVRNFSISGLNFINSDEVLCASSTPQFISVALNGKARRLREERANSNYLKLYALMLSNKKNLDRITKEELDIFDQFLFEYYDESKSLLNGQLQSCDPYFYEMELQRRLNLCSDPNSYFKRFASQYNGYLSLDYLKELKMTAISRHKLWTTMTLNPRSDDVPTFNSIKEDIVPCDVSNIPKMEFPWRGLKDFQQKKNASGVGVSGNRFIQYISKGSKSKRMAVLNNN